MPKGIVESDCSKILPVTIFNNFLTNKYAKMKF